MTQEKEQEQPQEQDGKDTTIINVRGIPIEDYRKFKAWCALNGVSVTAGIIHIMQEAVKEQP